MKCLIVDNMHESILPMLEEINLEADYLPEITRKEILEIIGRYQGLIIRSKTVVDQEFIHRADNLKFIARAGAGIDKLDIQAIEKAGIGVLNAPEGNRNAVAEHVMAMVLSMANNLSKSDKEIRAGIWDREGNRGWELSGKTIGLLGYGFMGMEVARKMKLMGCNVLAYDKYKSSFSDEYVREVSMSEIYAEADIFSIHVPLTSETKGLINAHYLTRFKKPVYIVNTARGEILVLHDLLQLLESGNIQGAALDVLENEKIKHLPKNQQITFERLIKSEKVLFSPHVAGWTFESYTGINEILKKKIQKYIMAIKG
ncbi:MAG: NAD(P)-dependent oxidoreductase [Bacteroidota bacterium]